MKLKKRLLTICSLIENNKEVYDIGCDHAYLDIFLTEYKNCKCHASDKSSNALKYAIKNIKENKLEDKIEVIVSDGLKNINISDKSTIVISGMGTQTIINILEDDQIYKANDIIIQSNNDHEMLRRYLNKRNLKIVDELVVKEKDIYYITIKVVKGNQKLTKKDFILGPILRKNKDIETISYYLYLLELKQEILKKMPRKNLGKRLELIQVINWLKRMLKKESRA